MGPFSQDYGIWASKIVKRVHDYELELIIIIKVTEPI